MAKYTASFCVSYRPEDGADGEDGPTYTFSPTSVTLSATTDDDGYPDGGLESLTLTVNDTFTAYDNGGNQVTISGVTLLGNTNCDSSSVSSSKIVIVPDTREVTYPDATEEEKSYTYDLAYSSGEILLAVTIGDDVFNVTIAWTGDVSLTTGGLTWSKAMLKSVYAQVTENADDISTISQTATEISASVSSISDGLKTAGIDITAGTITLTASKTVFLNSSEETIAIFSDDAINANLITKYSTQFTYQDPSSGSMYFQDDDGNISTSPSKTLIMVNNSGSMTLDADSSQVGKLMYIITDSGIESTGCQITYATTFSQSGTTATAVVGAGGGMVLLMGCILKSGNVSDNDFTAGWVVLNKYEP